MATLYELTEYQRELYRMLSDEDMINPETGEINPVLEEQLNITQESIEKKALAVGIVIKQLDADAKAIKEEKLNLEKRQKTIERNVERLKDYLTTNMQIAGISELEAPRIKLTFRKSEVVEILNQEVIDEKYYAIKKEISKSSIKAALKAGENVQGAQLVEKQNLQIK